MPDRFSGRFGPTFAREPTSGFVYNTRHSGVQVIGRQFRVGKQYKMSSDSRWLRGVMLEGTVAPTPYPLRFLPVRKLSLRDVELTGLTRHYIECDGQPRFTPRKWFDAVPHVCRKESKHPGFRLDGVIGVERR